MFVTFKGGIAMTYYPDVFTAAEEIAEASQPTRKPMKFLGVKIPIETEALLQQAATDRNVSLSAHVRELLITATTRDEAIEIKFRTMLAEAIAIILMTGDRALSPEDAIALVKNLFHTGTLREQLQNV